MRSDKNRAIELRKAGKSYNKISRFLNIPKSTLSTWLKNFPFSYKIKERNIFRAQKIWSQNITKYNLQRAQKARDSAMLLQIKSAEEIFFSQIDLKVIGTVIYWCEGYKRTRWVPVFCNSDPILVKIMMKFFRDICKVPDEKFRPQVQIHPNVSRLEAENYWSEITQLEKKLFINPLMQIPKSSQKKRPPHRLPYGTFRIGIADSTVLNRIKGWINGLSQIFS